MSKFTDDFETQLKDIKAVKDATRDIIEKGDKLAMEEIHDAGSLERLKREIKKK